MLLWILYLRQGVDHQPALNWQSSRSRYFVHFIVGQRLRTQGSSAAYWTALIVSWEYLRALGDIVQKRCSRKLAKVVGREWRVAGQHIPIAMGLTSDALVDRYDSKFAKLLSNEPRHLPRDVTDIDVGSGVKRVWEDCDFVALVYELASLWLSNSRCQHARRTMTQRYIIAFVCVCPAENTAQIFGKGDIVECAMSAGDEDAYVRCVFGEAITPYAAQIQWSTEFLSILLEYILNCLILLRKRPHLKFDWVSRDGGDVNPETCGIEVK